MWRWRFKRKIRSDSEDDVDNDDADDNGNGNDSNSDTIKRNVHSLFRCVSACVLFQKETDARDWVSPTSRKTSVHCVKHKSLLCKLQLLPWHYDFPHIFYHNFSMHFSNRMRREKIKKIVKANTKTKIKCADCVNRFIKMHLSCSHWCQWMNE